MPSTKSTHRVIINDIKADNHAPSPSILDLGAGYGGLCRSLANAFPQSSITGVEISFFPLLSSYIRSYLPWNKRFKIIRDNIFTTDIIANADIITCYLSPYHMGEFERVVWPKLKSGTIVYSQGFAMPNITEDKALPIPFGIEKTLYKYKK